MQRSRYFRIAAGLILILTAILWLSKGIIDMFNGIRGGINNILLAVVLFLLTWLSWKRQLLGGIITAFMAIMLAVYFNLSLPDIYTAYIPLLLICAPMVLSGLLFIEADWASKKRN